MTYHFQVKKFCSGVCLNNAALKTAQTGKNIILSKCDSVSEMLLPQGYFAIHLQLLAAVWLPPSIMRHQSSDAGNFYGRRTQNVSNF